MSPLLTDRKLQVRLAKNVLIALTIISAVVYIIGFHLKRGQWRQYYESELETYAVDERVISRFSDLMFITMIAFTILFTLIYIHLIAKEVMVGVLVVATLELVSFVYSIALITKPIALTPLELIVSGVELVLGFMYAYLLKIKYSEDRRQSMDDKELFSA